MAWNETVLDFDNLVNKTPPIRIADSDDNKIDEMTGFKRRKELVCEINY